MKFDQPLEQGLLLRRYKRFLADIETTSGEVITIHCPNTGSMKNCLQEGAPLWYSTSDNAKRKYPHTWEIATTPEGDWAGINTHRANPLVREAITGGLVPLFPQPRQLRAEVRYGNERSRVDFVVDDGQDEWYVEVKNVTLKERGQGYFPDAVSARGAKHLRELALLASGGARAALIYCVQHSGIDSVAPAAHIDPLYARAFSEALAAGVKVVALKARLFPEEIVLQEVIPIKEQG